MKVNIYLILENIFIEKSGNFVFNEKYNQEKINNLILNISFVGEKIFHGKPSGLDNTISLYGGIINFIDFREKKFIKFEEKKIERFKEIFSIYLIDSNVKRNTIEFTSKVKEFKNKHPDLFNNSINSIKNIVSQIDNNFDKLIDNNSITKDIIDNFNLLLSINQSLLSILQVSIKEIDFIINNLKEIEVTSKITGAGGGGFILALVDNDKTDIFENFSKNNVI